MHAAGAGAAATVPRWVTETGNGYWQLGHDVVLDGAGNSWVVGSSSGKFPKSGDPVSHRATTGFLAEYNARGGLTWSTQFGTALTVATGIARDAAGNLDIVGYTYGPGEFPGTSDENKGHSDAFVRQYDSDGNHVWTHLLGSPEPDSALDVATDADGDVYVVGETGGHMPGAPEVKSFDGDGWVAKYTSGGARAWVHQIASDREDEITGVAAAPGGGVDIVGETVGAIAGEGSNLGYWDVVVARYGADGTRSWLKQIGTDKGEFASGIAVGADGNIFLGGNTYGTLPGWTHRAEFYGDAFVLELDADGNQLAVRQFGAAGYDAVRAVALDAHGDVFVTGDTEKHLAGAPETNPSGADAFVARFASATNHDGFRTAWVHQIGGSTHAGSGGIAVTADGTATVAGWADGPLDGARRYGGQSDVFVARFSRVS